MSYSSLRHRGAYLADQIIIGPNFNTIQLVHDTSLLAPEKRKKNKNKKETSLHSLLHRDIM